MIEVQIDIQNNSNSNHVPSEADFERWAKAAVGEHRDQAEISVLIVDIDEGAELNHQWRSKEGPTNVLSFPSDLPPELQLPLLGDLVICAPVVEREAQEQVKTLESHWALMVVHGTLHLLGYDHIEDDLAEAMESLEITIMKQLGFSDPYQINESNSEERGQ